MVNPMKEIEEFIIKNDSRFYIYNLEMLKNQVSIALVIKCGSMREKEDQRGFSHLLEHMNISFDKYFYNGKIKCLGYTDYFYTYYLFCTDKSYLPECMERVNEIISGIYITDEIMKKIKPDVIEEYYKIIMDESNNEYRYLLEGTEYSKHLAIGDINVIKECQYSELVKFYKKYYISGNIDIIFMGNREFVEEYVPQNCKQSRPRELICRQKYCIRDFEWKKLGNKKIVKIYYLKRCSNKDKRELLHDGIFLSLIKKVIYDVYGEENIEVGKIVLSNLEEFIYIDAKKMLLRNFSEVKKFLENIVFIVDENYIISFISEYKMSYFNMLSGGYGINTVHEMRQCINSLIFDGEIIGSRELINIIQQGFEDLEISKIADMVSKLINNDESFFLYKIIEQ